mmetsp:Transcript_12205/g.15163  ORF Transcript_12205/g.15163 Transcript_12205/m.15163 type:complete len:397 (+) Transcript_12205:204-1394(+)|eukprot:CAMPEP_0204833978 /NCGR_PEP_ID=MMETSP1346-20131115/18456_1 /ASSEMBLY_ACC=CAM_ASM_000771 /TAXON_ID=215587 /ORGANISM="Aplanochytrium stocchinoi, Strain GSBS06" /LENGTH=396 /DNA_ID=CAMNT_0051966945 /DNA_START=515 /DNA_END=1705 /DNA_ORIENTATION=+
MGNAESSGAGDADLKGSGFVQMKLDKKDIAAAKSNNKKIDKTLKKRTKKAMDTIRLLLLGAGESGKTTVLKQMTLIHGGGFTNDYKREMRPSICYNVLEGAASCVKNFTKMKYEPSGDDAQKASDIILDAYSKVIGAATELTDPVVDSILLLLKDPKFEETFKGSEVELQDGWWEYAKMLEGYPAWGGEEWLPTDEDILLSRVRTAGIVNQTYKIDGVNFQMTDVGGQRCERKKWMSLFAGVTGVIFITALSEYNQKLFEDITTNRLDESVKLWETYVNKKEFADTALLLFLNKYDLFQQKYYYQRIPIGYNGEFVSEEGQKPPQAEDEANDACDLAIDWYKRLFYYHVRPERADMVYMHVTTALDKENMTKVIDACASHVLQQNMKHSGLIPDAI